MSHLSSNHKLLTFVLLIVLVSCTTAVKPSAERAAPSPESTVPKTFASPSEAGAALLAAAQSGDRSAVLGIFGPDGAEILLTGDPSQDATNLRDFVTAYNRMHRWGQIKAGGQTLYIGPDNYAFPIPLGQNPSGRWYFDTAAGKDEVLARRIGNHELGAIAACAATARAQQQYLSQPHDGKVQTVCTKARERPGEAERVVLACSGPVNPKARSANSAISGKSWLPTRRPSSALQRLLLSDPDQAGATRRHGKSTGGFAILAYPAEYRNSGIMTFASERTASCTRRTWAKIPEP